MKHIFSCFTFESHLVFFLCSINYKIVSSLVRRNISGFDDNFFLKKSSFVHNFLKTSDCVQNCLSIITEKSFFFKIEIDRMQPSTCEFMSKFCNVFYHFRLWILFVCCCYGSRRLIIKTMN